MLSHILRQMERDGLRARTVHPAIPHRVDYRPRNMGRGLAEAFGGVWQRAEAHLDRIEAERAAFDARA